MSLSTCVCVVVAACAVCFDVFIWLGFVKFPRLPKDMTQLTLLCLSYRLSAKPVLVAQISTDCVSSRSHDATMHMANSLSTEYYLCVRIRDMLRATTFYT